MRFLADMGISMSTISFLRGEGHDAMHLREEGLQRLPDSAIILKAYRENRVILTNDLDFGYLLALSQAKLPSVILFRLTDMRPANVNQYLQKVLARFMDMLEAGAIVSVTDYKIRARPLPI